MGEAITRLTAGRKYPQHQSRIVTCRVQRPRLDDMMGGSLLRPHLSPEYRQPYPGSRSMPVPFTKLRDDRHKLFDC